MKAKVCAARPHEFGLKSDNYKVTKSHHQQGDSEMAECFLKLKELVPTVPKDHKLSKVQLLQHVIDYIMDLEITLDVDPAMLARQLSAVERKPLSESTQHNTTYQTSHLDTMDTDFTRSTIC